MKTTEPNNSATTAKPNNSGKTVRDSCGTRIPSYSFYSAMSNSRDIRLRHSPTIRLGPTSELRHSAVARSLNRRGPSLVLHSPRSHNRGSHNHDRRQKVLTSSAEIEIKTNAIAPSHRRNCAYSSEAAARND